MKRKSEWAYSTPHECKFIDGLGTFAEKSTDYLTTNPVGRRNRLLRNYLRALRLRQDWGRINPKKVRDYALRAYSAMP